MRIILLCNSYLTAFDQNVLRHIRENAELSIVGMLINIKGKPGTLKRVKRELRKGRGGYVLIQIIRAIINKLKKSNSRLAVEYANELKVPYLKTNTLYSQLVYDWLKVKTPEILLLRGFGIIKEPILSIAPFGVLSYHHADITKYRGGPPFFWELYNNEKEAGITLQVLDVGLDTGTIVLQRVVPIKHESWTSLRRKVYLESESMAAEALLKLKKSGPVKNPIGPKGTLYTLPNLRQWLSLQYKVLWRKIKP